MEFFCSVVSMILVNTAIRNHGELAVPDLCHLSPPEGVLLPLRTDCHVINRISKENIEGLNLLVTSMFPIFELPGFQFSGRLYMHG